MPDLPFEGVPADLGEALQQRGFTELTPVQRDVLDSEHAGRDLRISSRTGSGKTVALGLVLADLVRDAASARTRDRRAGARDATARPAVLLVAPTRELAMQIGGELTWLFAPLRAVVGVVTGGASFGPELRMLGRGPTVLVATPGRLLDHMRRGTVDLGTVHAVALDEADEMLDMGFADELGEILDATPTERVTHLVSATFPPGVEALANRYQRDPVRISATPPGEAHADIEHEVVLVRKDDQLDALTNVLLLAPADKTLVFVRTRADALEIAEALSARGFAAKPLSGELTQRERSSTLSAFRSGTVTTLVATDVASRGLDVSDITRVVHFHPPENAEVLVHRSGRTGRAGKKGKSTFLATPLMKRRLGYLLGEAGVRARFVSAPGPAEVRAAGRERLREDAERALEATVDDAALRDLASQLLDGRDPEEVVAALLHRERGAGPCDPIALAPVQMHDDRRGPPRAAGDRRGPPRGGRQGDAQEGFVRFQISLGQDQGASPGTLLAIVCRRGAIGREDVGAIRIGARSSMVEVSERAAPTFARAAQKPDRRDPRVKIREWRDPARGR